MDFRIAPGLVRRLVRTTAATLTAAALLAAPTAASAAGTGDHPDPAPDRLTPAEAAVRARLEARMPAEQAARAGQTARAGRVGAAVIDAPYRSLYTPTHAQERSYWCGPATVQVIDDYFGATVSQSTIAQYLGTSTSGTMFTLVDDALRYYTGKPYYLYRDLTAAGLYGRIQHSILDHGQPLAADVRIDADVWPAYVYDHDGHIVPVEAFNWRNSTVRLNDVYDERHWRAGGGATLGHVTYTASVLANGIALHPLSAVVSAP